MDRPRAAQESRQHRDLPDFSVLRKAENKRHCRNIINRDPWPDPDMRFGQPSRERRQAQFPAEERSIDSEPADSPQMDITCAGESIALLQAPAAGSMERWNGTMPRARSLIECNSTIDDFNRVASYRGCLAPDPTTSSVTGLAATVGVHSSRYLGTPPK